MSASSPAGHSRPTKTHKIALAAVAGLGAAALALTLVPAGAGETGQPVEIAAAPVAVAKVVDVKLAGTAQHVNAQSAVAVKQAKVAADDAAAKAKAAKTREAEQTASRSAARMPVFANNLDGWIREALFIMKREGIPGTYAGIHRNVMRESSGNPMAINNWDINARNGIPSKGLLQVIYPTFKTYHVKGTKFDQYDPVANIVAACNYAADRYGSMDNVNSAY
ncbi:transglycosylase SLT domain-containing protein [Streptomyces sp. BI20]|uniref:transglycosylase SLT domain-containing protein n=1 Tax=Streptomyces sp. BI20 TaxID=3403460 RepID=UPI003C74E9B8